MFIVSIRADKNLMNPNESSPALPDLVALRLKLRFHSHPFA